MVAGFSFVWNDFFLFLFPKLLVPCGTTTSMLGYFSMHDVTSHPLIIGIALAFGFHYYNIRDVAYVRRFSN